MQSCQDDFKTVYFDNTNTYQHFVIISSLLELRLEIIWLMAFAFAIVTALDKHCLKIFFQ